MLLVGISLAAATKLFLAESCIVPSTSMEGTLLVGDFVLVSKVHYGARLPSLSGSGRGVGRLPGLGTVRRGNVVVFDGVGESTQRRRLIKRVIGVPGDVVRFEGSRITVNGVPDEPRDEMQRAWVVRTRRGSNLDQAALYRLGFTEVEAQAGDSTTYIIKHASAGVAAGVAKWPDVVHVFPCGDCTTYNGTIQLPRRGERLCFTSENALLLTELIDRYEGSRAEITHGEVLIDGRPATAFVFTENYYFVVGDNRDASIDSRAWGAVPERNVIGRAVLVYFSWDSIRRALRFGRLWRML